MIKLKRKRIKGHPYWYAVSQRRIKGKLKDEWQVYLGSAKKILKTIQNKKEDQHIRIKSYEFGKLALLLAINQELGFTQIVDRNTSKKYIEGLSVGEYLLIVIFGRWVGPLSKKATAKHFKESFLKFYYSIPHKINAQNIINHLKYIKDKDTIEAISSEISKNLLSKGVVPSILNLDTTNFFTYIEKGEEIPRKGKSKQKQYQKNLIGLALVANEANIPFLHETYPGNIHDSKLLPEIVDRIVSRLETLKIDPHSITIVMDKGNNSEDNIKKVLDDMHIVGSLKRDQAKDFFDIPINEFEELYTNRKRHVIKGYRSSLNLFEQEFTIVVNYNQATEKRQKRTYEKTRRKFIERMKELKQKYERKKGRGRRMSQAGVIREVGKIIHNTGCCTCNMKMYPTISGSCTVIHG